MKEKLEDGFLLIPKEVLTLTKINSKPFGFAEKAVYSYLLQWSKTSEKVFPSMRKMCLDLGVGSRTSMTKYINKLEECELLCITKFKGKSSQYDVLGLDGKVLTLPKEPSIVKGTNQDLTRKDKVVQEVPVQIPSYSHRPYQEDDWDDNSIPF